MCIHRGMLYVILHNACVPKFRVNTRSTILINKRWYKFSKLKKKFKPHIWKVCRGPVSWKRDWFFKCDFSESVHPTRRKMIPTKILLISVKIKNTFKCLPIMKWYFNFQKIFYYCNSLSYAKIYLFFYKKKRIIPIVLLT